MSKSGKFVVFDRQDSHPTWIMKIIDLGNIVNSTPCYNTRSRIPAKEKKNIEKIYKFISFDFEIHKNKKITSIG